MDSQFDTPEPLGCPSQTKKMGEKAKKRSLKEADKTKGH
jgi:hypothetical protein